MNIVISQPMYFPWIGIFEQIQLSDIYVHYDDVQFSKGSFTNRVQIKTDSQLGFSWLTVPLKKFKLGAQIDDIEIDHSTNWQNQHLNLLTQAYRNAPYREQALNLVNTVFDMQFKKLSEVSMKSIELAADYFDLSTNKQFYKSSDLGIEGKSSERVYKIVNFFNGDTYITGHGAKKYLDHNLFENNSINVEYINYLKLPYSQQYAGFNPFVSILDLIANLGQAGRNVMLSQTINWQEFVK